MRNYFIWKNENDDSYIMVEVFNECDLPSIQEKFTKEGYVIWETFLGKDKNWFFVIGRLEIHD